MAPPPKWAPGGATKWPPNLAHNVPAKNHGKSISANGNPQLHSSNCTGLDIFTTISKIAQEKLKILYSKLGFLNCTYTCIKFTNYRWESREHLLKVEKYFFIEKVIFGCKDCKNFIIWVKNATKCNLFWVYFVLRINWNFWNQLTIRDSLIQYNLFQKGWTFLIYNEKVLVPYR